MTTILLHPRRRFLALLAAVALAAAMLTSVVDTGHSASQAAHRAHSHAAPAAQSPARAAFQDQMRKLWEDHVTWTRLAIVAFADESAGFDAAAGRLLQNQADIGDAIRPFYGDAAGDRLTALLRDHILIAVELLKAARAEDTAAFESERTAWYANSDEIADFLAAANPRYWPQDVMRHSMREHLDQTLAEASHELSGDYAASVADYDRIHDHILMMADVLSSGIVRAFPRRFH